MGVTRNRSNISSISEMPAFLSAKPNAGMLNLLIGQKPHKGFVVEVNDVDPVAEGVPERTPKS